MPVIQLTRGLVALVSEEDAHLAQHRWHARPSGDTHYAARTVDGSTVYLHRVIVGATSPEQKVDHWSGDGLDNRRENLRIGTHAQNLRNRRPTSARSASGITGVHRRSDTGRWAAYITLDGRHKSLGSFATAEEARGAREAAVAAWWAGRQAFAPADMSEVLRARAPNRNSTTGSKGISQKADGRWVAYIGGGKTRVHLGTFATMEEAQRARDAAELKRWG